MAKTIFINMRETRARNLSQKFNTQKPKVQKCNCYPQNIRTRIFEGRKYKPEAGYTGYALRNRPASSSSKPLFLSIFSFKSAFSRASTVLSAFSRPFYAILNFTIAVAGTFALTFASIFALALTLAFTSAFFLTGCAGQPEPEKPEIFAPPVTPRPLGPEDYGPLAEPELKPEPHLPDPQPEMQFEKKLSQEGVDYHVCNFGIPGDYELTVFVTRGEFVIQNYIAEIDWSVLVFEITDLNNNGFPELFITGVYEAPCEAPAESAAINIKEAALDDEAEQLSRPGSQQGVLIGWEYALLELRQIRLPPLTERQKENYLGGDTFIFENRQIVREYQTKNGPAVINYQLSPPGRLEAQY